MSESQKEKAAKGQDCTIRLPGCRNNTETVVYAHFNKMRFGKGKAKKAAFGAFACFHCHNAVDGKGIKGMSKQEIDNYFYEAGYETLMILNSMGIVKL